MTQARLQAAEGDGSVLRTGRKDRANRTCEIAAAGPRSPRWRSPSTGRVRRGPWSPAPAGGRGRTRPRTL